MRTLLSLAILTTAAWTAAAADPKLDGKWTVESLTRDGTNMDLSYKGGTRVHTGDKYTFTPPLTSSQTGSSGTFTADAGKIDMKPDAGRYKGQTLQGIYKVDGDTLTIAFAEPGKDRPAAFESKPGSGVVLAVHKKAK